MNVTDRPAAYDADIVMALHRMHVRLGYDRQAHLAWHEREHPGAPEFPREPWTEDETRAAIAAYSAKPAPEASAAVEEQREPEPEPCLLANPDNPGQVCALPDGHVRGGSAHEDAHGRLFRGGVPAARDDGPRELCAFGGGSDDQAAAAPAADGPFTRAERRDFINVMTADEAKALLAFIAGYAPAVFDTAVADRSEAFAGELLGRVEDRDEAEYMAEPEGYCTACGENVSWFIGHEGARHFRGPHKLVTGSERRELFDAGHEPEIAWRPAGAR